MEHHFWHEKWEANDLAFHRMDYNPVLDIPAGSSETEVKGHICPQFAYRLRVR